MAASLWARSRALQLLLAGSGDHRRVPPAELLIAAAAEASAVTLIHYDRDLRAYRRGERSAAELARP